MDTYDPAVFAGKLEKAFQASRFKSYANIADAVGVSRSTVSSLAKARKQSATGKATRPRRELVVNLATVLEANVDEFLLAAGHAPSGAANRELFDIPGVGQLAFESDIPKEHVERMKFAVEIAVAQARAIIEAEDKGKEKE